MSEVDKQDIIDVVDRFKGSWEDNMRELMMEATSDVIGILIDEYKYSEIVVDKVFNKIQTLIARTIVQQFQ